MCGVISASGDCGAGDGGIPKGTGLQGQEEVSVEKGERDVLQVAEGT